MDHSDHRTNREPMRVQQLLKILRARKLPILLLAGAVCAGTLIGHLLYVPVYRGEASIIVGVAQQNSLADMVSYFRGKETDSAELARSYFYQLRSRGFQLKVAESIRADKDSSKLNLAPPLRISLLNVNAWARALKRRSEGETIRVSDPEVASIEELAGRIFSLVDVQLERFDTIKVVSSTLDSYTAMALANSVGQEFLKLIESQEDKEFLEVSQFIRARLAETTERLRESELALVLFKKAHGIVSANGESGSASIQLRKVQTDLETVRLQLRENQKLIQHYTQSLSNQANDLDGLEATVARAKISDLKEKNSGFELRISTLQASESQLIDSLSGASETQQELLKLTRSVDLEYEIYSSLKKRIADLEMQRLSHKAAIQLVASHDLPAAKRQANLLLKLLFVTLVSFFAGGVAAFAFEYFDPRIKHRSELEDGHLIVVGEIPKVGVMEPVPHLRSLNPAELLVCRDKPDSAESMAFKYLRARMLALRSAEGTPVKSLVVTSPEPADGKSFIASNLAISLAQSGKKTCLIDCDLYHPAVHRYFELEMGQGLVSLIRMESVLSEVTVRTKVKNLHIIPAGPAGPAEDTNHESTEMLNGERFRVLVEFLKKEYDYLIFDAPPINGVVDAAVVAGLADGVMLVARHRKTRKDGLSMAYQRIQQISYKQVYGLLNDVDEIDNFLSYYASPYMMGKLYESIANAKAKAGPADKRPLRKVG